MTSGNETPKLLYALHTSPDHFSRVFIEHGAPKYMALYYEGGEPGLQYNWYGVMDNGTFSQLSLAVEKFEGKNVYTWTFMQPFFYPGQEGQHYSSGDIYTTHTFYANEEDADIEKEKEVNFSDLMQLSSKRIREMCRERGISFGNFWSRTKLAMLLAAPVPQEPNCPQCGVQLRHGHDVDCGLALCNYTGKRQLGACSKRHPGFCGMDHWTGYEPGVLESFVYSVTPERVINRGTWDRYERVFVYDPNEEGSSEVDETVVADGVEPQEQAVTEMLSALGQKAKQEAVEDPTTQEYADRLHLDEK